MVFTIKINGDENLTFKVLNFDGTTFSMEPKLTLATDDLKAVKSAFTDLKLLEVFRDETQIGSFTSYDTYKDISFESGIYDSSTGEWIDVLNVTLTKASIVDQVQRLDAKVNQVVDPDTLSVDEYKEYLQEKNKAALAEFLTDQSVEFNGKPYGVGEDDQNEMALNLMQYQALTQAGQEVSLEWHSKKSKCEAFTAEEFLTLTAMIKAFVYPYYQYMQTIKEAIFGASTKEELDKIVIKYELIPVEQPDPTESTTPFEGEGTDTDEKTDETEKDSATTEGNEDKDDTESHE